MLGCLYLNLLNWIGDGICDDLTNNMECNYDGGDCCLDPINDLYCSECQCLGDGGSTTDPGPSGTTGTTTTPSGTLRNDAINPLHIRG